jgi:hypothetical protein
MLAKKEILELFELNHHGLRQVYLAVYGTKVGEELFVYTLVAHEKGEAHAVSKSVHKLYMDADDKAPFVQATIWDVVSAIAVEAIEVPDELLEVIKTSGTVHIGSEKIEEGDDDVQDLD